MIDKYPNVRFAVGVSDELTTVSEFMDGAIYFLPKPFDFDNPSISQHGRIFYRGDWVQNLGMTTPRTTDEFFELMRAFTHDDPTGTGTSTIGLAVPGNWFLTNLLSFFSGLANDGFTKEDGRWIPNYYSERMIPGLQFIRDMYDAGFIDPEYALAGWQDALTLLGTDVAGAAIRNGGDPWWLQRTIRFYTDANPDFGTPADAWEAGIISVMPPLIAPGNTRSYWNPRVNAEGYSFNHSVDDELLDVILHFIDWGLEPAQFEMGRHGIEGVTYSKDADGRIDLFPDPESEDGNPFNITVKYPGSGLLKILTWDAMASFDLNIPSTIPDVLRIDSLRVNRMYDEAVIDEGPGFMLRMIYRTIPEMMEVNSFVDFAASYGEIIIGSRPVAEMFADFRSELDSLGMQNAIDAMTAIMAGMGY
jgi:hypothetical protein